MATTSYAVVGAILVALVAGCDSAAEDAHPGEGPATSLSDCPPTPDTASLSDEFDLPYEDLPDSVPDGAEAAQLCGGGGSSMELPADVLVTDVDDLVEAVNQQPEQAGNSCTADGGPGYRILFSYDDGSTFLISAGFYGCESVVVGSIYREGPAVVLRTFQDLVVAQRAEQEPPSPPTRGDLTCWGRGATPDVLPIGLPEDVVRAVLCQVRSRDRVVYYSAPVSRGELDDLLDDFDTRRDARRIQPNRCPAELPATWIVGTTAWGDRVEVASECRPGEWRTASLDEVWSPSRASAAILDRLVSETRRVRAP